MSSFNTGYKPSFKQIFNGSSTGITPGDLINTDNFYDGLYMVVYDGGVGRGLFTLTGAQDISAGLATQPIRAKDNGAGGNNVDMAQFSYITKAFQVQTELASGGTTNQTITEMYYYG